jgi:hypothetical protein
MMFILLVSLLSMSSAAQYNTEYLNAPVDSTYFLGGELDGNWNYGVMPEMVAGYNDHLGARTMVVFPNDSIAIDGHKYCVAYSKQYRNRKTVMLIDWFGDGSEFAELVLVVRKFPFGPWVSAMLVAPKGKERYKPEPVYYELYRVDYKWL